MKDSAKQLPLILASVICAVSLVVMVLSLGQPQAKFVPPPFEKHAVYGVPDVPEELDWRPIDATVFQASVCGRIIPSNQAADIWLYNAADNTVWLKVRLMNEQGDILGETGILKPGEYVQSISLSSVPAAGTPVVMKLMAYEPETYHSEGAVNLKTQIFE